jgi:PAS domain S-box-containing protein
MFKLSLRMKFLVLSALAQALVVGLLIWNSLRLMDNAVNTNAARVAHEYAVTLNLSLSPYATSGRLAELRSYLGEMISDQRDSFVRYIVVLDATGQPILQVGAVPPELGAVFATGARGPSALETRLTGAILNARAPLLLKENRTGALHFGISTDDLDLARDAVLTQGSAISLAGFAVGLLLLYLFTSGIARRLTQLTGQSMRLSRGEFNELLPERGGDELEVFSRSLNTMSCALRERIDQLELAEQRLQESEERFKILFDTAPVPLTVTDHTGVLMATNLAFARNGGYQRDEVLGKRTSDIGYWSSLDERSRIWDIYQTYGQVEGEVGKIRRPDGSEGDVLVWSSTLALDGRAAIIWALLDVTEELKAKRAIKELNVSLESRVRERSSALEQANHELSLALETLKRTQHDLISAEKMASLGALVAGIAHELNTPIGNSLLAATTLSDRLAQFKLQLLDGTLKRSLLNEHVEDVALACTLISGSLNRAANLIASFKQVAADQTNDQRRSFELRQVLDDTVATFAPSLKRANCSTRVAVDGALTMVSYPGSLCQVINNLINNALMHAFEGRSGGQIDIAAHRQANGNIAVVFHDDGNGMPEEVARQVFDPFFTTKMGRGGTGLGMNIVYNIVNGVLGGRISVESAPGLGTTISIDMPPRAPQRERKAVADSVELD